LKNNFIILLILTSIFFSFSSCNAVKYVPENEHLLTKNTIIVNDKKTIDNEISDYIIQRPNQLVLGLPLPLHFYNIGNKNFETNFEVWKKNHPGCPGIGVKRAADLLDKHDFHWEAVCQAYREKGLSDDDALLNARLAKILQYENYDFRLGQPILWQPPATPGDKADNGATVQNEKA
jgi:hypothetical protein